MSERLNADVTVTAVAFANQASIRFDDARVVRKDILHLDSVKSVPGILSRHGRTTPFTYEFCNVRHITTTADSNGRVSVVARVARAEHRLVPSRLFDAGEEAARRVRVVFLQMRGGTRRSSAARRLSNSALAPATAANPRVLMMPGGNIAPNALRPLRRLLRPTIARSGLL